MKFVLLILMIPIGCSLNRDNGVSLGLKEEYFPRDTILNNIEMVFVPKGIYKSGMIFKSNKIDYDYWIGKYEITNLSFFKFLESAISDGTISVEDGVVYMHYKGDSLIAKDKYRVKMFDDRIQFVDGNFFLNDEYKDHPVVNVTWYGAKAFCDYYGFVIPSEEEWEKAARGMENWWFPWGNSIDSSFANYKDSGDPFEKSGGTTPVGFYNGQTKDGFQTSNAQSYYGCYDMSGNAWEWTRTLSAKGVPFFKGKGGGYSYHIPAHLQIYYVSMFGPRYKELPPLDLCNVSDGFRVVKMVQ